MANFFKVFTILFLLTLSISVKGQWNYKPGRIITNTNDTLVGLINDGGGLRNAKYCIFKSEKQSEPKRYFPNEIKSYYFLGDKYYSSEVIPFKKDSIAIFCDMLMVGKISLFLPRTGHDLPYYIKMPNGNLVELSDKTIVFDKTVPGENPIHYEKFMYHDTLYSLFKDAGITKKQIANTEYNDKSLLKISKAYIDSAFKGSNSILYERNSKIGKHKFGVFTGAQISSLIFPKDQLLHNIDPELSTSPPIGLLYNSPLNLLNDRLSFQIELMLTKYNYNVFIKYVPLDSANQKFTSTVFTIPLYLKYGIKINRFTPTLGFGKELGFTVNSKLPITRIDPSPAPNQTNMYTITNYQMHWQQKGGWFFDLGLTYQINTNYALFSSFRLQTQRNLVIEDGNSKNYTYYKAKKDDLGQEYRTNMASIHIGVIF